MQAIVTKYVGPGNVRGARIIAKCKAGRVSIPYPHELSGEAVHRAAAVALCDKLDAKTVTRRRFWDPAELIGGALPNDAGYCFVFASEYRRTLERVTVALGELCTLPNKQRPERVWDEALAAHVEGARLLNPLK